MPSKRRLDKTRKYSSAVFKEITGITFLSRGISANFRAISGGVDWLKKSSEELANQKEHYQQAGDPVETYPTVSRQIFLINAVLSFFLMMTALLTATIVSVMFLFDAELRGLLSFFASSPMVLYSSILVAIGGLAYVCMNAYASLNHIKILIRSTKVPYEYSDQLRGATTLILSIAAIHAALITGFQITPADDWITKLTLGIIAALFSIGTYKNLRYIYSPNTSAKLQKNLLISLVNTLILAKESRPLGAGNFGQPPLVQAFIVVAITVFSFITKNDSLIALFSTLVSITALAILGASMMIVWGLEDDRPTSD
ncbi:hypothetical protein [uncultured Amphritea sp.]|uniref:hypothetical protein n=1 Tax=uncultured Amphritea sp. TaxID=981605 RepID=UPI0026159A6D|nr:hypothetical protein [uncultured Amphritea sp.]